LEAMCDKKPLLKIKLHAPYQDSASHAAYLNPESRTSFDAKTDEWTLIPSQSGSVAAASSASVKPTNQQQPFAPTSEKKTTSASSSEHSQPTLHKTGAAVALAQSLAQLSTDTNSEASSFVGSKSGLGIDVEDVSCFANKDEAFLTRNFTDQELQYCRSAPNPAASLAARWSAKEAVIKAISSSAPEKASLWKGAGAALKDIEIVLSTSGAPVVKLSGHAQTVATQLGVRDITVSMSHASDHAIAQAVAFRPA